MKLTPQIWNWSTTRTDQSWLANGPADPPMVWQAERATDAAIESRLVAWLSAEERIRLARFHQREDQLRFLTGRGLLRLLAGLHLNLPPERVELSQNLFGKPCLVARPDAPALHFNVSHSGNLVWLAFHTKLEVGVDVEEIRPNANQAAIARRVFASEDYDNWLRLESAEQPVAFYQIWTRHEAGLKAMGAGFSGDPGAHQDKRLAYFELALPAGYRGTACSWRAGGSPAE